MKKLILVLLLLLSCVLLSGCELPILFWISTGIEDPVEWTVDYPLEEGEYWVFDNEMTVHEKENGIVSNSFTVNRRDSVVVIGEEELPNNTVGIRVVDYWTADGESGEIHHFYEKRDDGLFCLGMKYENGMNVYRDPVHPQYEFFVELSPLPGNAIIPRDNYHEDGYTVEMPKRKVYESFYEEDMYYYGDEYGRFYESSNIGDELTTYRTWECCELNKSYDLDGDWEDEVVVRDYLSDEGLVKRQITVAYMEVLDEDGAGTGLSRKYNITMEMIDGTYMH